MTRTRDEYLKVCKDRAHEYLARGDVSNAVTSMLSDLSQHPETKLPDQHPMFQFGMMAIMNNSVEDARRLIDGFH